MPKTEPMSTWSLVLGILSVICLGILAGIPAIILGKSAQRKIDGSNGTLAGREMATIGVVLGWISVAIMIFAIIFMVLVMAGTFSLAFLAQKAPQFQKSAARASVETSASFVGIAYSRYRNEHGNIPSLTPGSDEEVDTSLLITALSEPDTKGTPYYSATGTGIHINGIPSDPWGNRLHFAVDLNGDGKVTLQGIDIPSTVVAWSSGPNGKNDHGTDDDVISWEATDREHSLER